MHAYQFLTRNCTKNYTIYSEEGGLNQLLIPQLLQENQTKSKVLNFRKSNLLVISIFIFANFFMAVYLELTLSEIIASLEQNAE